MDAGKAVRLFDYTDEVAAIRRPHSLIHEYRKILVHRSAVADGGVATARWYADKLGWRCPYHFYINEGGTIQQLTPLCFQAPGAWRANPFSLHIAVAGDFRTELPTPDQTLALVELCIELADLYPSAEIDGHCPWKPGRSKNPLKKCPGKRINMDGLRQAVSSALAARRSERTGHLFA